MSAGFDESTFSLAMPDGVRVAVSPEPGISAYVLLEQEDWFEDEIRFLRRLLKPGMRALDIGANHGVYALAMATRVGPLGRVLAFEPDPRPRQFLDQSIALNELARVLVSHGYALSDFRGSAPFALEPSSELNSMHGPGRQGSLSVQVETLDYLKEELRFGEIDFVKIDAEGEEPKIVAGGRDFFASSSPLVQLEIRTGETADASALQQLLDLGYQAYRLLPEAGVLVRIGDLSSLDAFSLNLFACKPERARLMSEAGLLVESLGPAESPRLDPAELISRLAPLASGDSQLDLWRKRLALHPEDGPYLEALACYLGSRDPVHSAVDRVGFLERAVAMVQDPEISYPRDVMSAGLKFRILRGAGMRFAAVEFAKGVLGQSHELPPPQGGRAFLPALERFESIDGSADPTRWMLTSLVEAWCEVFAHSGCFAPATMYEVLLSIADHPERSIRAERMMTLAAFLTSRPASPAHLTRLLADSPHNPNAAAWRHVAAHWPAAVPLL